MVSRSTVLAALVVAELVVLGVAAKAVAGDSFGSSPLGLAGAPYRSALEAPFDRNFVTGPSPHVVVDVRGASVVVRTAGAPLVHVAERVRRWGWIKPEVLPVSGESTADGVRITGGPKQMHFVFGSLSHQIEITAPASARVEIVNAQSVETTGLRAKLVAHVADGAIHINDHRGDVDVSTGSGRITMLDVQGSDIAANTRDGRIYFTRVGADRIDASSGSGRIVGVDVRATNGALTTRDGRIVISFAANSDASVRAHTADGKIEVSGLRTSRGEDGKQLITLGEGHGTFDLSTADGNIILTQGANV